MHIFSLKGEFLVETSNSGGSRLAFELRSILKCRIPSGKIYKGIKETFFEHDGRTKDKLALLKITTFSFFVKLATQRPRNVFFHVFSSKI